MNPKHFLWHVEGKVGVITLNRPERKNPLTFDSYAELREHFRALAQARAHHALDHLGAGEQAQPDAQRAVVVGAGNGFTVGIGNSHGMLQT